MASVYSITLEPGVTRYVAGKAEATSKARNHSIGVDHVVTVYEHELLPNTTRLEGIVHALNGEMITTSSLLAGYKRGRSLKGWTTEGAKETAKKLRAILTDLGEPIP